MTKILVADDHTLLADAVSAMLNEHPSIEAITTDTFQGVLSVLAEDPTIDMVLLDLKMPGMSGLDSIQTAIVKAGKTKIVLFTGAFDQHFLNAALDLGCHGLIPKTMPLQSLVSVIDLVMSGEIFVPRTQVQTDQDRGLNDKELFVLRLAADGLTNKEIAREMNASEVMVKMHMRSICKKLNARNRAHAAIVSRELSII